MRPLFSTSVERYNRPNLPPVHIVQAGQAEDLPNAVRSLPHNQYDLTIFHGTVLTCHHVAMLYELKRVLKGPLILIAHRKMKRYRQQLMMLQYERFHDPSIPKWATVWEVSEGFTWPRCKTDPRHVEKLGKNFYRSLLKDCEVVLEVLPQLGTFSQRALRYHIPAVVLVQEGAKSKRLASRLKETTDGVQ